jgi:hypothetical protein
MRSPSSPYLEHHEHGGHRQRDEADNHDAYVAAPLLLPAIEELLRRDA